MAHESLSMAVSWQKVIVSLYWARSVRAARKKLAKKGEIMVQSLSEAIFKITTLISMS
jgi:hypothetical protein